MPGKEKHITCAYCGCQVSSPVPAGMELRAWVQCYKCDQDNCRVTAIVQLIKTIRQAAVKADWCDLELADAIIFAEKCLPDHLLTGSS